MAWDMKDVVFSDEGRRKTAASIAEGYDSSILVNRWLGAWVDFLVLLALLLVPDYLLGNELYNKTIAIWLGLLVAYFPAMESFLGGSVGKFVANIRVVSEKGGHPTLVQSVVRTLFRLIEVNPFVAGGIPAGIAVLCSGKRQRLGDMVARTYVLRSGYVRQIRASQDALARG